MRFQSLKKMWDDVREKISHLQYDDVKRWYDNNTNQHIVSRGQNSFVANRPYDEWEVDLFFVNDKADDEYKLALAGKSVFSRFGTCLLYLKRVQSNLLRD